MAINDMILPGVKNPLLAVAEEIRKQISAKALEQPKTSPPVAGMPEDRDYAEGMQRPELTKLKTEREFKATPSRTSAFLVALGNILQDKQNLEAAKQQTAQNEYNAKLSDAMELNKLFKTGKMKREFDETDPDTQLRREMLQLDLAQKKEMYPLDLQYKQSRLDSLFKKGTGGDAGKGGAATALGSGSDELDQKIEAAAWDYSQEANVPIEDARIVVANNMLAKAGKNTSLRQALGNVIKQNTVDPLKQRIAEANAKIKEAKLKLLEEPDPVKQTKMLQDIRFKEANIKSLEKDYGVEVESSGDIIEKYVPKPQAQQPKEGSIAEKIVNGKKTTFIRQNGKWVSQ